MVISYRYYLLTRIDKIMSTTIKRRSFCSTKEIEDQLEYIRKETGENNSNIIKKAITSLYSNYKSWKNPGSIQGCIYYETPKPKKGNKNEST